MCEPLSDPVARAFSAAASSYDAEAQLQRQVGQDLLLALPSGLQVVRWLDLGCGTGHFCTALGKHYPQAQGVGLDIATGMLQQARSKRSTALYVCGDARTLPLADSSLDLVFSSLALQWCEDLDSVLQEVRRVLKPGGLLAFSSLAQGTLHELSDSWLQACGQPRVNTFRSFTAYEQACAQQGWQILQLECRPVIQFYPDVRALLGHLKGIGAGYLQNGRSQGLLGRASWQRIQQAYEGYRQPAGLPASWQVVSGVLRAR